MGKEVHSTRLLTFVSRPVPDILKPVYSFGGLSLSQLAKPYVDNWLRTRQAVSDLIRNFSVTVLQTNMSEVLNGGGAREMFKRAHLFNKTRDNRGLMIIDKEMENLINVATPLSSLDTLQAQSQEHMATVFGIPLIILFAITPTGLNASSDAELKVFEGWVLSQQEACFTKNLTHVMHVIMLSEWGEIDQDITFSYVPLAVQDLREIAEINKLEADTDAINIEAGIISPEEARTRIAQKDDTPYAGLDVGNLPIPPGQETEMADPMQGLGAPGHNGATVPVPAKIPGATPHPRIGQDTTVSITPHQARCLVGVSTGDIP
jgi:phage-related protein (TIGR01555 family)